MRKPKYDTRERKVPFIPFALFLIPAVFLSTLLVQTASAKTYVITDGARVVTCTSFATDPCEVLDAVGLSLDHMDSYITEGNTGIRVQRAQSITLHYRGQRREVSSTGETVGQLLERLKLELGEQDVLSHDLQDQTFSGMQLRVDSVITRRETYTSTLTYETVICLDDSLPEGSREVLVQGRDGELLCTADVTYINGVEAERQVLSRDVTIAPVTEVIGKGTGEIPETAVDPRAMPIIGDGYILLPTGEVLTYTHSDMVRATGYTHTDAGCDMITSTGTTVRWGTVAVDPRYIPYGTRMFIVSNDGEYVYGIAVAEDCGGAIKGDRMDLYFPTYNECIQFGRRRCTLYFLG